MTDKDNLQKFLSLLIDFISKYNFIVKNTSTNRLAFEELIQPICDYALNCIKEHVDSEFINSQIIKQLEIKLQEILTQHLLGPIFFTEFIKYRPLGINYLLKISPQITSNSSEYYDEFILHTKKELKRTLLEYPVLADLLYIVINDWIIYVKKIYNLILLSKIKFNDIENIELLDPLILKFTNCAFAIYTSENKRVYLFNKNETAINFKELFNKIAKLINLKELAINCEIEQHDDYTLITSQLDNSKISYEKFGLVLFILLLLKGNKLDSRFFYALIKDNFNSLNFVNLSMHKFSDNYEIKEEKQENIFNNNSSVLLSLNSFQNNTYIKRIFIDLNKIVVYSIKNFLDYQWLNLAQDFLNIEIKKENLELEGVNDIMHELLAGFKKGFEKFSDIETIEEFFRIPEIDHILEEPANIVLRGVENYQHIFVSSLKLENLKNLEVWEKTIKKKLLIKPEQNNTGKNTESLTNEDTELVKFEMNNIPQGILPSLNTNKFSQYKLGDINLRKFSKVKLIDKKTEQLARLPLLYYNSINSDPTVNNVISFKLGLNVTVGNDSRVALKSKIDGLKYKLLKNDILLEESVEDQKVNGIQIDKNGIDMYTKLKDLINKELKKFDYSSVNESIHENYYQFLLYRTLLQTVALQSNFLEWRCPAYLQTQQVNYFHPLNQTNYIVNYDRGNSHFLSELETHLAKVLNVDTTKYSFYLTSSGMAAYKLIETILMFDYLKPGDTILIPHYIYFETYEQIIAYKHLNIIYAENAVSADEIINLLEKHKPKVLFLDPLLNTENLEYIDTEKILNWLDEQDLEMNVVIDVTMLSGLYRPENYLKADTKIKLFFYESCTKYLQLGLDTNMAGYIVVPKKLNMRAYGLRMRTGSILYDNAVANFPIYKRQDLIARTELLTSNAVFITDFINNSPTLSSKVEAHHPSCKSHKHYDLVHSSEFENFTGGLIGFSISSIKGDQKQIDNKLGEIVDVIMSECKNESIPITKGLGFGFVLARICVNTFFDHKTPSYLRLYVGELDKNNLVKLCEVLNKVFGKLEAI